MEDSGKVVWDLSYTTNDRLFRITFGRLMLIDNVIVMVFFLVFIH